MVDDQEERREIEAYLGQHHLQAFIGDAVNDIVKERPPDPLVKLGDALLACSDVTKQIQKVRGRQRLNGEGLPAVEIAIRTAQGCVFGAVSAGPLDGDETSNQGRGGLRALESVENVLSEILVGKDPTCQAKIDELMVHEDSLPANIVTAASIACCKAAAKQTRVPVSDYVGTMCSNPEGAIPPAGFSVINGGRLSASSLWVQDIFVISTDHSASFSDRLLVASTVHHTLEACAREAGQDILRRGPRGGFCNDTGTFEHLMDCLMASLKAGGFLESVEVVVDVHASRLLSPRNGEDAQQGEDDAKSLYDLSTFDPGKTALEMTTAETLLEVYLEWLEKYPIAAFVEPFAAGDVSTSKELLVRGNQVMQAKAKEAAEHAHDPTTAGEDGNAGSHESAEDVRDFKGKESCDLRVISDESVSTPAQLALVHEQRGANAIVINMSKLSTVTDCIALANRASKAGWAVVVSAVSEEELEGEFLAEFAVGLTAEQFLMGGLRSASTLAASAQLIRIEDEVVPRSQTSHE